MFIICFENMTDADYEDDQVLLANTPVQAESHLLSMAEEAWDIGLYVSTHKTEFLF